MSNVIDLTRRFDGKLSGISLKTSNKPNSIGVPPFLQEVSLGHGLRGCYFKNGADTSDFCYYDLAWLKIPEGFTYVNYQVKLDENGSLEEIIIPPLLSDDPNKLTNDLLTPLLLLYEKDSVASNNHICASKTYNPVARPEVNEGCAGLQSGKRVAPLQMRVADSASVSRPFYLFYYEGFLRTQISESPMGIYGKYYLIPLVLSERLIVYYAFKTGDLEEFAQIYSAGIDTRFAEIVSPLTNNDGMGILVTNQLLWERL